MYGQRRAILLGPVLLASLTLGTAEMSRAASAPTVVGAAAGSVSQAPSIAATEHGKPCKKRKGFKCCKKKSGRIVCKKIKKKKKKKATSGLYGQLIRKCHAKQDVCVSLADNLLELIDAAVIQSHVAIQLIDFCGVATNNQAKAFKCLKEHLGQSSQPG
jgi:hypothetical protein